MGPRKRLAWSPDPSVSVFRGSRVNGGGAEWGRSGNGCGKVVSSNDEESLKLYVTTPELWWCIRK